MPSLSLPNDPRTTTNAAAAWHKDQFTFAASDVLPQALILSTSTVAGTVVGDATQIHVGYVDEATADFVAEGERLPEQAPRLAEALISTGKISCFVPVSHELWYDAGAAQVLADAVAAAVTKRANQAYLAQPAPTGSDIGPAAGLLNVAGIVDAGNVSGNLDGLIDAVATVEANGAHPTHILCDPLGWAYLAKMKTASDAATGLLGAGTTAAQRMLLSLPVIVDAAMPAMSALVIDKSAVVSAVGPLMVASSDQALFAWDAVAVRATWRFGQAVVRPDRIAKLTIGPASK